MDLIVRICLRCGIFYGGKYIGIQEGDMLSESGVRAHMPEGMELVFLEETGSTNTVARELAARGAKEGTVVLAKRQTAGRGRLGRSFMSPEGGIYLTVIMRPEAHVQGCVSLTMAACAGVCRALGEIGVHPGIKWVNDLYYRGRKVCGILAEGAVDAGGTLRYALVGVGLNYASPGFDGELGEIAGSLFPDSPPIPIEAMAGRLMGELYRALKAHDSPDIYEEYRAASLALGRKVRILRGEGEEALAYDITRSGGLVVRHPDGREEELSSGEVSIAL